MNKFTRSLIGSATLTALIWLVLVQIQPSPASAGDECFEDCPVTVVVATPPPPPPVTGADSSAGSIGDLGRQRFNQMITNRVLGSVLLGVNEQVNCSDCVSAFGSAGSFSAGIHGRKKLTPNLSLLAGIAYTQYSEGGYHITDAPIGAFALRYDFVDDRRVRAPLRFRRLGVVTPVLRRRRHPVAVREGPLQPQLHDKPRPGFA